MLSDYINSCESIKTTVGNNGTSGGQGSGDSGGGGSSTSQQSDGCSTQASSTPSSTCPTTTNASCPTNGAGETSNCQQATTTPTAQQTETQNCNTVQQQQIQTPAKNNNECSFKVFCEKVKNGTCNVLKEIECKECKECTGSEEICTKFISVTIEHCEKEAECLIIQLNEDLSPELVNTIVLRFIGLQLYLRIIQEFSLLREYFTKIIENLSTCYNTIKSCTCGSAGQSTNNNCSKDSKCVCTIFYKLFKAIKTLHNRYCKIINYIRGECDEDLYKVIPSLSLTRSVIILTSYFNDYINSDYMVEESSCGCGYNEYVKPSLIGSVAGIVVETVLRLLSNVTKSKYTGLRTCPCHKYSSKLDDVVTLLQTGIDDTDDCDGLLSDVISMMSPLVKDKCVDTKTMDTTPSTTHKDAIDKQLEEVNNKKKDGELETVIPGIKNESKCDGTAGSSAGGGTAGSSTDCTICSTETPSTGSQTTQDTCNGTDIGTNASACGADTTGNGVTTSCTNSVPTKCKCECEACKKGPGECCCFFKCKDCNCETADNSSKTCLKKMVELLSDKDVKCNNGSNGKDCLMCYLCVLKSSICKLKNACNVNSGSDASNGNLHQTLQKLPENIINVVGKICGTTPQCCEKCTDANGCKEDGTCKCNDDCCKVNDRFSNFTKFLLGTDKTSTENNNCKTIANTLIALNKTLKTFIGNGDQNGGSTQCNCTNNGNDNCTNKCCCGTENCTNNNGCKENKPVKILRCVVECGLKGIKERSSSIVQHIENIVECLECIKNKMTKLEGCYCDLHKCISGLKDFVNSETKCIEGKICKLKEAKQGNQGIFSKVIKESKDVLSDICGLYRVYSMESYSYYLSP